MEWNTTKWDWENHEEIEGSFNLSGVVGGSGGGSASDLGNNSSAKSSISASTESSFKEGIKVSKFSFEGFGAFANSSGKKKGSGGNEINTTSPILEASVSSGEPFIGLKLGKRTYFENNFTRSNSKTSFSDIPVSSVSTGKKVKSSCQSSPLPRCQVEGCNLDLSSAKEYHRKHRVCETHSKCPKVVVGGVERRFCQQCSRFHSLSEFDEKKRSCRRRLSDHNARRRKPQQETIQFNSSSLSSSFYGGRQQLSFVLNNAPMVQSRPGVSSQWENSSNSTFPISKVKADKSGVLDGLSHTLGMQLPNMPTISFNRSVPPKGSRVDLLDQGFKETLSPNVDALDLRRALSLLSNNSWGIYDPDLIPLDHPHQMHPETPPILPHANANAMQSVPQTMPLSTPDYWHQPEQHHHPQPLDPHVNVHALPPKNNHNNNSTSNQFQEFQLFNRFYSNPMDEILK